MLQRDRERPYRSPSEAARETTKQLLGGASVAIARDLEGMIEYDPKKHIEAPREIELKVPRFALEGYLTAQIADESLGDNGYESRLEAVAKLRGQDNPDTDWPADPKAWYKSSEYWYVDMHGLLLLMEDWERADHSTVIDRVINDPANQPHVALHDEYVMDALTDPRDEVWWHHQDGGETELRRRLSPNTYDLTRAGYLLLKWGLELVPRDEYPEPEDRRGFLHDNIPFFLQLSRLDSMHNDRYIFGKWFGDLSMSAEECGVGLRRDANGIPRLAIQDKVKPPEKTNGRVVRCPMGFEREMMIDPRTGAETEDLSKNGIVRFMAAYVNEAYDRNLDTAS